MPKDSNWIKPGRLHYIENDVEKQVDIIKTIDGVVVILYNKAREKLIFVRQFRGAVYQGIHSAGSPDMSKGEVDLEQFPPEVGVTLELCGGAVDKDKSLAEIAKEEVLEECGYEVPTESCSMSTTIGRVLVPQVVPCLCSTARCVMLRRSRRAVALEKSESRC